MLSGDSKIHPLNPFRENLQGEPPPLRKEGEEKEEGLTPLLDAPH
jgi:hypothetical protein